MAGKYKSLKPFPAPQPETKMKSDIQSATEVLKKVVTKAIKKADPDGQYELQDLVDNQIKMVVSTLKHEYEAKIFDLQTKLMIEARDKTPLSDQEIMLIARESGLDIQPDTEGNLHWYDDEGQYVFDEMLYTLVRNIEHAFGIEEAKNDRN
mgnify:CR=1 FL=1